MHKITALNEVQSKESEEDNVNTITKEAQEQFALNEYNRALQLLIEGNKTEALNVLLELLDTKLLNEVQKPPKQDGHARPMLSLKYACYKNIANIQADLENYHEALINYWQAINLDDTDVMIWYKIGTLALNKSNLEEACFAFRQGLQRNENHWPCLDSLITVLYAIPDYMNCLMYISLALEKDPTYAKGLIFCKEILKIVPSFDKFINEGFEFPTDGKYDECIAKILSEQVKKLSEDWNNVCRADKEPLSHLTLEKPLESLSWIELGEKMMYMIKYMNENHLNLLSRIVLTDSEQLQSLVWEYSSRKKLESDKSLQAENSFPDSEQMFCSKETNVLDNVKRPYSSEFQIGDKVNCTDDSPMNSCDESQIKEEPSGCIGNFESNDKDKENVINEDCKLNEKEEDRPFESDKADTNVDSRETQKQKKVKKRRRSSLCILTEWHWSSSNTKRSSRISNRKDCEKDGVEETLKRMFPPALLPDNIKFSKEDALKNNDSMETMDAYYAMLNKENNSTEDSKSRESFKANSPSNEGQASYFGLEQESLDVWNFIKKYSGKSNMITLITKYIEFLCTKWNQKWPNELAELYIQLYLDVKKYTPQFSPINDKTDDYLMKLRAEAKLLYCELLLDRWLLERASTSPEDVSKEELEPLGVQVLSDDIGYIVFSSSDQDLSDVQLKRRMLWLKANLFLYQGDVEVSLRIFELLLCHLRESQIDSHIKLGNCKYNATISADSVQKTITLIERSKKFGKIKQLYEEKNYAQVSNILKDTFYFTKQINEFLMLKAKSTDRVEHFKLLLDSLWQLNQFEDCYVWAEACFNESWHNYLNTIGIDPQSVENESEKKTWVDSILYTLKMLDDCVSEVSIFVVQYLKESRRSRLVKNLVHFVSHQLEMLDSTSTIPIFSILPWILLHYILQYEEDRGRARAISRHKQRSDTSLNSELDENDCEIPASMILLFKAHTFLGRHGWCCVEEGRLLIFIMKTIVPKLNFPLFAKIKAKLKEPLEQVVFCLYGHPAKVSSGVKQRPKYLEEHTTQHMPLTWETCQILLEFYKPEVIPSYDTKRVDSISADTLDLFKKMSVHVPKDSDSQEVVKEMYAYLHGNRKDIPRTKQPLVGQVSFLYYFIADYYFKNLGNQSWAIASKYYVLDLCQHSDEFNSWAGLAMSTSTMMETWLNNFEPNISEEKYLDKAQIAQRSYQHAVDLDPSHLTIWTEYGNFLYTVHSFCSRLLKQESDSLNMRRFEVLENQKDEMLNKANHCFSSADNIYNICQGLDETQDERWLYQYMLGKIAEKKNEEPPTFLRHYLQAGERLSQNNAQYPRRISHSNPPTLSIEALEVYYRIYASILKYLEQHEGKPLKKSLAMKLLESLRKCLRLPFVSYDCTFYKVPADQLVSTGKARGAQEQWAAGRKSAPAASTLKRRLDDLPSSSDDRAKLVRYGDSDLSKDVGSLVNDLIMEVCSRVSPKRELVEQPAVIKFASSASVHEANVDAEVEEQSAKAAYAEDASVDDNGRRGAEAAQTDEARKELPRKVQEELRKLNKSDKILHRRDSQESSTTTQTSTSGTNNTSSSEESSSSDDSSDSSSSSDSDSESMSSDAEKRGQSSFNENTFATDKEINELVEMCLAGLEQCILRFPEHYKSVYRLAYFYFNNRTLKNINACKQLLLATYECRFHPGQKIQGLFADRKNANFFNGIWRIPVQEIDRPGSFASHMSRCVSFLMQVLKDSGDSRMLTELCIQLQKVPDADKKYLRDNEREQLACQALTMCIQCLRNKIKFNANDKPSAYGPNANAKLEVLLDIHHTYQRIKSVQEYEGTLLLQVKKLMEEGYVAYSGNLNAHGNLFEIAKDCCRQQIRVKNRVVAPGVGASAPATAAPSAPSLIVQPVIKIPATQPQRKSQKNSAVPKPRGRPPTLDKFANLGRANFKPTAGDLIAAQANASLQFAANPSAVASNVLQNPFLQPEFLAAMLNSNIDSRVADSVMQYLNIYGNAYNRTMQSNLTAPIPAPAMNLNYGNSPAKSFDGPAASVPSDKAAPSAHVFGSIKARPDVSITPVMKTPHPKIPQPGGKTTKSSARPGEAAPLPRATKPTNLTAPPDVSLLKPSQAHQLVAEHAHLNQLALNLLDNPSAGRGSLFPCASQASITPVKSLPTAPRTPQLAAPLQHPVQSAIKPAKGPSGGSSQPSTSLQHKLLSSKQHQPYHGLVASASTTKEDHAKAYYASSRKSTSLVDPNDVSVLSSLSSVSVDSLQSEILKSLGSPTPYPLNKKTQSAKTTKRPISSVGNPVAYSMKSLPQDIGNALAFPRKKLIPEPNVSGGYPVKHSPLGRHPATRIPTSLDKIVEHAIQISKIFPPKKPETIDPTGLLTKKYNQEMHASLEYPVKKKLPEVQASPGFPLKKPAQESAAGVSGIPPKKQIQDVSAQYSNSVLNRLQQHSHLEIIPQSNRSRQVEPMNSPVEFSAVNNPSKPINFINSDSVSLYELPKRKPNAGNPSSSAARVEKEAAGSKVEIITLDD